MTYKVMPLKEYKNPFKSNKIYNELTNLILKADMVADLNTVDPEILILPLTINNILTEFKKPQLKVVFRDGILRDVKKLGLDKIGQNEDLTVAGILIKNKNTPLTKKGVGFYYYNHLYYDEQNLTELSEHSKEYLEPDTFLIETIHSKPEQHLFSQYHLNFLGVNYSIPNLTKLNDKIDLDKFIDGIDKKLNDWINRTPKEENYKIINNVRKNLDSLLATPEQVAKVLES